MENAVLHQKVSCVPVVVMCRYPVNSVRPATLDPCRMVDSFSTVSRMHLRLRLVSSILAISDYSLKATLRGCLNTLRVPWTYFSTSKFASCLIRYAQAIFVFALPDGTLPSNAISLTHSPRPGSVTFCSSYYRLHRFIVLAQRRYLQIAHRSCPEYMSNVSSILQPMLARSICVP